MKKLPLSDPKSLSAGISSTRRKFRRNTGRSAKDFTIRYSAQSGQPLVDPLDVESAIQRMWLRPDEESPPRHTSELPLVVYKGTGEKHRWTESLGWRLKYDNVFTGELEENKWPRPYEVKLTIHSPAIRQSEIATLVHNSLGSVEAFPIIYSALPESTMQNSRASNLDNSFDLPAPNRATFDSRVNTELHELEDFDSSVFAIAKGFDVARTALPEWPSAKRSEPYEL